MFDRKAYMKEYCKKYYQENKKYLNEKRKKNYQNNKSRDREAQKRYGEKTRDIPCNKCNDNIKINNYRITYLITKRGYKREDILAGKIIICENCKQKEKNEN